MRRSIACVIMSVLVAVSGVDGQENDLRKLALPNELVTITFKRAAIRDALSLLGTTTGIEIKVGEDIKLPLITGVFESVSFEKVFTEILKSADLRYEVLDKKTISIKRNTSGR